MKTTKCLVGILVLGFSSAPWVSAEPYVGIILDGFQKNCRVQSKGEENFCKDHRQLFPGDKVIKLPNHRSVKIKWAPYGSGKEVSNTTLLVTFDPPENKKGVAKNVKEMVGFVKTKHSVTIGATRNAPRERNAPQPAHQATVLPGEKIAFVVERGEGRLIAFKDTSGKEVFRKDLAEASAVHLTPEEIGLKPSEVYSGVVKGPGGERPFKIRLLSDDLSKQVLADLKAIDREAPNEAQRCIRKAAYLQWMSDAYPKEIDLYWMSHQVLKEIKNQKALKSDEKMVVRELTDNYFEHTRSL